MVCASSPSRASIIRPGQGNWATALVLTIAAGSAWIADRASAIRQHVLEMSAPVVADALGYHQFTTAKLAAQTGGTWSRYAAGDHLRTPSGWTPQRTDDS